MGREVKRVALDFDWPLNEIWKGYDNPYWKYRKECPFCGGSGNNPETKKISDDWYTHLRTDGKEGWSCHLEQEDVQALIDGGRLWDFVRVPINEEQEKIVKEKLERGENSWLPFDNGYIPTAQEVNEWSRKGIGHDSLNHWICVKAKAKRLGVYGLCEHCKGDGDAWLSEKYKKLHDEWEEYEPPEGEGWQLWENVSEGSPISPVFKTREEFKVYLIGEVFSENAVDNFIEQGYCFSLMITPNKDALEGIESCKDLK